jgi:hypothetical protein
MPPTDTSTADDTFAELKPSTIPPVACGPCRPPEYGDNPIKLPNIREILEGDQNHQKRGIEP